MASDPITEKFYSYFMEAVDAVYGEENPHFESDLKSFNSFLYWWSIDLEMADTWHISPIIQCNNTNVDIFEFFRLREKSRPHLHGDTKYNIY